MNENEHREKSSFSPSNIRADVNSPRWHLPRPTSNENHENRPSSTATNSNLTVAPPPAGNSNSFPGRNKIVHNQNFDQQLNEIRSNVEFDRTPLNHSPPSSSLVRKKNLSTSDLDPFEKKKQNALSKAEAKLEKARNLHKKVHQSVEEEISGFLRITTLPKVHPEGATQRTMNATFDKRIQTLQETKKELERKINVYQQDILRIQAGDIPTSYSSSKDIFSSIKTTAAKVTGGNLKHRTSSTNENSTNQNENFSSNENEQQQSNSVSSSSPLHINSSTQLDTNLSSISSSISNEFGNSQFYIDSTHEHIFDSDKSSRKHENNIPGESSIVHDVDRSPLSRRRLTDDSNSEFNDRISDNSNDERILNSISSKRIQPIFQNSAEFQQLTNRIENLQKLLERNETKSTEMQKQIDKLQLDNEILRAQNERLNGDFTDLTDLHQVEIPLLKTDLKNLEERLLYKFSDYWNDVLDKLDKLDTRTARVEQTQTHSSETDENTYRIISKLVNILLTLFAIVLLLLSTVKNLVQSRVHAVTLLILVIIWISFNYLPENYFQTSFLKRFSKLKSKS